MRYDRHVIRISRDGQTEGPLQKVCGFCKNSELAISGVSGQNFCREELGCLIQEGWRFKTVAFHHTCDKFQIDEGASLNLEWESLIRERAYAYFHFARTNIGAHFSFRLLKAIEASPELDPLSEEFEESFSSMRTGRNRVGKKTIEKYRAMKSIITMGLAVSLIFRLD